MPDSHTIAENLTRLQTARTNIATAITTKGGTVATGAGLEDFPTAIGTIPAGGGGDIGSLIDGSITSCTIPSGTTKIKNYTFSQCHDLVSVTIPSSVTDIGDSAFSGCWDLASPITIPTGVTALKQYAFSDCYSIPSITLPNTLISLNRNCLANCRSLTSLTIPSSVTQTANTAIFVAALAGLSSLQTLTFESSTPPLVSSGAFGSSSGALPTTCTIRVPAGSLTAYTTASNYPDPNTYTYVEY